MIERYALSPLKEIWELEAQYKRWLEVELSVVEAYEETGLAPEGTASKIRSRTRVDVAGIAEIEEVVDHDMIAFIKYATQNMGEEARYFHLGLTSSDVVDTAVSMALKESGLLIVEGAMELVQALREQALAHKRTVCIGRTHGVHAEPTSFGLKFLSFLVEMRRNIQRLQRAIRAVSVGKLSGAVGNYANVSPEVEGLALKRLELKPTQVATQIVPRDIHAEFVTALAITGSSIERMAVEFRHLQRTEVLEIQEPFKKGQRGSSAMPHKKNPILCERLTGMARVLRGYSGATLEDIALWHERDISHSSVERIVLPDATMLLYYMLKKSVYLVRNLQIYPERMMENLHRSRNLIFSQRVMLALVDKGISREDAYKFVQGLSMKCWEESKDFKEEIENSPEARKVLSEGEIDSIFDPEYYLRNVDEIFTRILNGG